MIKRLFYDISKVLPLIIFFLLLLVATQLVYTFFKTEHSVTYNIRKDDFVFEIDEDYQDGNYYFRITDGEHVYHYENRTNFNKQDKVIKDIMVSDIDGYRCIYPIYQQLAFNQEGSYNNISCSKDGISYMGEALTNIISLDDFKEEIKAANQYTYSGWTEKESETGSVVSGRYYTDNLLPNFYVAIWNYRQLINLSSSFQSYVAVGEKDVYENKYGTLVGQYYVIPEPDESATYKKYNVVDLISNSVKSYDFSEPISTDSYINGVVDNKLYIFDRSNLVQYEINPKKGSVTNTLDDENAKYYDGTEWSSKNVYEMKLDNIYFGNDLSTISELQSYQPSEIVESSRYYYLLVKNQIYKIDKEDMSHPTILLTAENPRELVVNDDYLFYISDTTLYYYEETLGSKPIFTDSMFQYTYRNVYDVYKK